MVVAQHKKLGGHIMRYFIKSYVPNGIISEKRKKREREREREGETFTTELLFL